MKTTNAIMRTARTAVLFSVVAVAAACSNDDGQDKQSGISTPTDMTLTADFPTSRVGFDVSGHGYWHSGDDIAVWSATAGGFVKFDNQAQTNDTKATFTGKIVAKDLTEETLVLYPYSSSHTQTTYNLPSSYTYTSVDEDYTANSGTKNSFRMPMKGVIYIGSDGKKTITFSHIGGVLAVKIASLPTAKGKVTVTSNNLKICGNSTIGTDGLTTADGGDKVSFSYEGATAGKSGVFYLPVAPGSYSFTVQVIDESDSVKYTATMDYVTIQRGHIKKFIVNGNRIGVNGHWFVDLGLPSGLLWAETNLGAATETDNGKYYAWGETTAYNEPTNWGDKTIKTNYHYTTYRYGGSTMDEVTKYKNAEGTTTLEASDDAATANWGAPCRMPTITDIEELLNTNNCTWTLYSGKSSDGSIANGYRVTSTKNGNSILITFSGKRSEEKFEDRALYGYYWSSSLTPIVDGYARALEIYNGKHQKGGTGRFVGLTVRAVAKP